MIQLNKIVYPTDFSSSATPAYFHALNLAETAHARLSIVYVFTPEGDRDEDPRRNLYFDQLRQIRPINPDIPVEHVLLEGEPVGAIVRYAAESGADLIVLGTPDQCGFAERILRQAPCSVLIVKPGKTLPPPEEPNAGERYFDSPSVN